MENGRYRVTVSKTNNPTYLSDGEYDVEVQQHTAYFRNTVTHGSTFEDCRMLAVFTKQGRVTMEKVS